MRNKHPLPSFYQKKKNHHFLIIVILAMIVFIFWGISIPKVRQVLIHPLYNTGSLISSSASSVFQMTLISTPIPNADFFEKVYPTLSLPDRDVLFAEDISDIEQADPLAEFRVTSVPEDQINAAQWVFLDEYDPEGTAQSESLALNDVILPAPVYEHADLFNDGPAALSASLRFLGKEENQYQIASSIRPGREDVSISMEEMSLYISDHYPDLSSLHRINGTSEMLVRFLSAGYPVLIPLEGKSHFPAYPGDDGIIRVFVLVTGYESAENHFIIQNPFSGPSEKILLPDLLSEWYSFLREYLIIFPSEDRQEIDSILGENISEKRNISLAADKFRNDHEQLPENIYSILNNAFALQESGQFSSAYDLIHTALQNKIPDRYFLYDSRLLESIFSMGHADELISICDDQLNRSGTSEELWIWKGWGFLLKEDYGEAKKMFQKALEINPSNPDVQYANQYFSSIIRD